MPTNVPAEVGSYVSLYVIDNSGKYHISADAWDEIDAAYHGWIERRIDRVLALTTTDGADLLIAASRIGDVCASTPETRARGRELEVAAKAEAGFSE